MQKTEIVYYPFTAVGGQERLKKALLCCLTNPGLGDVF